MNRDYSMSERIAMLENETKNISKNITALDEKVEKNHIEANEKMEKGFDRLAAVMDNAILEMNKQLGKKAGKWVERVLWSTGAAVGMAVLVKILELVLK